MNDPYEQLGVRRRINAAGALTRLGGAVMAPEVVEAMAAASRGSVDIGELQDAASARIAEATGAEAGLVTTGAAAALTLAAAAAIARWDVAKMAALPHVAADILLPRTHRTGYAHALAASGARLVDIGHNDRGTGAGVRGLEAWEIEAALSPSVVAVGFSVNADHHRRPADRRRGLPGARHSADRRCRGAAAAQGEPAPLHRHGRRPRRLLRRQGAGRAAGLGHPRRAARPGRRRRCCSSSTWMWRPRPGRRRS